MQITSTACDRHADQAMTGFRIIERSPAAGYDRLRLCEVRGCSSWTTTVVTSTDEPEGASNPYAVALGAAVFAAFLGGSVAYDAIQSKREEKARARKRNSASE